MKSLRIENSRAGLYVGITAIVLALFGLVMIYSASSYTAAKEVGDSFYFVKKQAIGFVSGIAFFVFCVLVDYHVYLKLKWLILGISFVLLGLVFMPGIGVESLGARRWIGMGSFTIQPSEIAKFGFVLFAAGYMSTRERSMEKWYSLIPILIAGVGMCVLILLEPNMSITVCLALIMMFMLFIGGARIKHLMGLSVPFVLAVPALIVAEPYRFKRLLAFLDPWASPRAEGYQLIQSLYALGSGGWFGVGLFQSRQKYEFLPFSESDFVFSIIGEEFGLVGSLMVIAIFFFLIVQGIRVALQANDRLGCYMAAGITAVIAVQVLINIAVVTGSIPPTGLPLPFISYGGSSLMVFLASVGILVNISRAKPLDMDNKTI